MHTAHLRALCVAFPVLEFSDQPHCFLTLTPLWTSNEYSLTQEPSPSLLPYPPFLSESALCLSEPQGAPLHGSLPHLLQVFPCLVIATLHLPIFYSYVLLTVSPPPPKRKSLACEGFCLVGSQLFPGAQTSTWLPIGTQELLVE